MGFSYHNSGGAGQVAGPRTTQAATIANVSVGDLVVVVLKFEDANPTIVVSDGVSTLTEWVAGTKKGADGAGPYISIHYLLASVASGSVTYTATFSTGVSYTDIGVMVYTPTGTVSLDGTANGAGDPVQSTSASSGNITTTGTDGIAFGGFAEFGTGLSSSAINGVAPSNSQNFGSSLQSQVWAVPYSVGFTGAATAILSASNGWACGVIAFQIAGLLPNRPGNVDRNHFKVGTGMSRSESIS